VSKESVKCNIYVLKTGIQWPYLPKEMGCASTIHGKFRKWVKLGVFEIIMDRAIAFYENSRGKASIWYATDVSSCKAPLANTWSGDNPTDRGKQGVKKSIIVDRRGAPLAISVGPANSHDSQFFDPTFSAFKHYDQNTLKIMAADSAYHAKSIKNACAEHNFILMAATNKRRSKHLQPFKPRHRWIVERTFAWLNCYRRIKICWAKAQSSFLALCCFACSIQLFKMGGIFV
jgi:putative transposase